jgi:hypothetical protein
MTLDKPSAKIENSDEMVASVLNHAVRADTDDSSPSTLLHADRMFPYETVDPCEECNV